MGLMEVILRSLTKPGEVWSANGELTRTQRRRRVARGARPVPVNTGQDPRYSNQRARGYGATSGRYRPLTSPRVCRPVAEQPRTSVAFRQFRRAGFDVRQNGGKLFAVPVAAELVGRIGAEPVEIGVTI